MTLWGEITVEQLMRVLVPIGVGAVALLVFLLLRKVLYIQLQKWAARSKTEVDDVIIHSTKGASLFWCLMLAIYIALQVSELSQTWVDIAGKVMLALLVLSMALVAANLLAGLIRISAAKAELALPVTGLTQTVVKVVIMVLGVLIVLETVLGVRVTSLLAALGVGSLAVALALQDTLSNIFAGAYITMGKNIRVGDYIKMDTGDEGYVLDVSWRVTKIRTLANNILIVPNSKLSQAIVMNYYLYEPKMAISIPVSVSYEADPDHVERVLVEEAKSAASQVPGLLANPDPTVRFVPGFGDYSLNFTLYCHVKEFTDQYLVQHELRKRIFKRLKKEGIEIPFPIRIVYTRSEPGDGDKGKSL